MVRIHISLLNRNNLSEEGLWAILHLAIRTTMLELKAISILAALGTSVLASNCEVICILFYCFFVCWPARQSHFSLQSTSLVQKITTQPTSRDYLYCSFLNLQADQFQCNDGTCISLEQRQESLKYVIGNYFEQNPEKERMTLCG